jgi:hypothetical protein
MKAFMQKLILFASFLAICLGRHANFSAMKHKSIADLLHNTIRQCHGDI